MNDLERRALLGDAEAQRECTEKGIVLACPCCGAGREEITYCADTRFVCEKCGLSQSGNFSTYDEALARWNTRPAPPIGRCGECGAYTSEGLGAGHCSDGTGKTDDGYCDCFYPKDGEENG